VDIPFNWPYLTGKEQGYIAEAHAAGRLAGDGPYTKRCHAWLEETTGCARALLTHSCTAALEMTALLLDIQPGDEVIMPSFTFVSTANAFVLRGAQPVFVDIRADTLNLDERLVEAAITTRTRAIVAVHYAGVACEMDALAAIARRHALALVEDAAQGVLATYRGRPLGALGDLGTYSFHETKTIISGEGGALLVNDPALAERAEIVREKGTDRSRFYRGEIDKYTWQDIGSSFLPGEIVAAFLWAQLEEARAITEQRLAIWRRYAERLAPLEDDGRVRLPVVPPECRHNGQMFHVLLERGTDRGEVLRRLAADGVSAVFHYVPLHSSPGGHRFARVSGDMSVTDDASARLIRLPMWVGLTGEQQDRVAEALAHALGAR
jgi:dTDP-4-amino-4,6-dideoxygalactose transaminase